MLTLWNTKKFVKDEFGNEKINEMSSTKWFPIDAQSRLEYVMHIQRSSMTLEDNPFKVAGLGAED